MDVSVWVTAAFLGVVEGLTEFLPVSSTGHLILVEDLIGFQGPPGKVFEIAIQLGAILAVCWLYRVKLTRVALNMFRDADEFRFARNVVLAFLPAAVVGVLAYGYIKRVLFSPWVVSVSLIVGGLVILLIERRRTAQRYHHIERFSMPLALSIGLCQCVSMIPGVSRSGATIMGALMLGADRKAAAEFSFFLAIPTMLAATLYDVWKNRDSLASGDAGVIAIGMIVAFISALTIVRPFVTFISLRGFTPFAWYRIAVGLLMLAILYSR